MEFKTPQDSVIVSLLTCVCAGGVGIPPLCVENGSGGCWHCLLWWSPAAVALLVT